MIRDLVESVSGYPGLFAFCATSGLIVPLPEDFSLLYAGVRIAGGDWSWAVTLIVAMAGVLLRDVFAWGIGRLCGGWLLSSRWMKRLVGEAKLARAQELVAQRGPAAILAGRFFIGFRAPVFMVAGAMGVSLRSFCLWDLLGLVVAVPAMVILGYAFGEPLADLVFWGLQRTRLVVLTSAALAGVWLWWRMRQGASEVEPAGEHAES